MSIAVVTDTGSGIFEKEAEELGVYVVPMPVLMENETKFEGVDINLHEFLEKQTSGVVLTSSLPSPASVMECWDRALEKYDELIYIPLSSSLSGSYSSAMMLKEEYDGRVYVADTRKLSILEKDSVLRALDLIKEGKSAQEVCDILEANKFDSSVYVMVDTLKYLQRSGRLSATAATIGTVLNIKPVLAFRGEKLDSFAKVRTIKKAQTCIIDALRKDLEELLTRRDKSEIKLAVATSFDNEADTEAWRQVIVDNFPGYEVVSATLPLCIVCHIGPNGMGAGILA